MRTGEAVFVDAGAWIALADRDDANHGKAAAAYPSLLSRNILLITRNFVVAEAYIVLLKELGHAAAFQFLESVKTSPRIKRVYSTEDIESETQAMLAKYSDQDFSYADAVSFTIMKRQNIKKASHSTSIFLRPVLPLLSDHEVSKSPSKSFNQGLTVTMPVSLVQVMLSAFRPLHVTISLFKRYGPRLPTDEKPGFHFMVFSLRAGFGQLRC